MTEFTKRINKCAFRNGKNGNGYKNTAFVIFKTINPFERGGTETCYGSINRMQW